MRKHIPRKELKVGMVVICGDANYRPRGCWSIRIGGEYGGEYGVGVPSRITKVTEGISITHTSLDGAHTDTCCCSDLDHLYLYESEPMTFDTMEVGTIVRTKNGTYPFRRILSVLGGEGELKTYVVSDYSTAPDGEDLKRALGIWTAFDFKEKGYTIYFPEAPVEMTMEEINKALGKTVKVVE